MKFSTVFSACFLLLVLLVASMARAAPAEDDATRVRARVGRAIVLVRAGNGGEGTGFLFTDPHWIVTAWHVIRSGDPFVVTSPNGDRRSARVSAIDREHDVALLTIDDPFPSSEPLVARAMPPVGERVWIVGYPGGGSLRGFDTSTPTISEGVVSATIQGAIRTDATAYPGNSGGPLVDRDGAAVGVVTELLAGFTYARSIDLATALLGHRDRDRDYRGDWHLILGVSGALLGSSADSLGAGLGARLELRMPRVFFGSLAWRHLSKSDGPQDNVAARNIDWDMVDLGLGLHFAPYSPSSRLPISVDVSANAWFIWRGQKEITPLIDPSGTIHFDSTKQARFTALPAIELAMGSTFELRGGIGLDFHRPDITFVALGELGLRLAF